MEIIIYLAESGKSEFTSLKIRRGADGFLFDWNSLTFKSSGWGVLTAVLSEIDSVNLPGFYNKIFSVAAWEDGNYQYVFNYLEGDYSFVSIIDNVVMNGREVEKNINTLLSTRAAPGDIMGKSPATLSADDVTGNVPSVVKAQDNIDFGALQKASITAAVPSAASIWGYTTRSLTSFGSLISDIWGYTTRTLSAFGFNLGFATPQNVIDAKDNINEVTIETVNSIVLGSGAIQWTYILTKDGSDIPIADCRVWISTDIEGVNIVAFGHTDDYGKVTFQLDAGTVYVWRKKSGFVFDNPDTETIG